MDNADPMEEGMFFYADLEAEDFDEVAEWLDEATWEGRLEGVKVG